jgi:hypothetical protein
MNKTNGIVIALLVILIGLVSYSIFKPKDNTSTVLDTLTETDSSSIPVTTKTQVIIPQNTNTTTTQTNSTATNSSSTVNSGTIANNVIKLTTCGVSFSKTSDWDVISNTSNEIKLDIITNDHTEFSGIDIKCVLGNSITDNDAKYGSITYYYDSSSQKWMVNKPDEQNGGTLPAVVAVPEFNVNGLPVFRGTGRWLTYIVPISPTSIISLKEGDSEGGLTQSLTNLVKTLKRI